MKMPISRIIERYFYKVDYKLDHNNEKDSLEDLEDDLEDFVECSEENPEIKIILTAGDLYKLYDGFRAFINGEQVNYAFYYLSKQEYSLYFENDNTLGRLGGEVSFSLGHIVNFRLDRVIYETVIP